MFELSSTEGTLAFDSTLAEVALTFGSESTGPELAFGWALAATDGSLSGDRLVNTDGLL
jgi:hypothetical protein